MKIYSFGGVQEGSITNQHFQLFLGPNQSKQLNPVQVTSEVSLKIKLREQAKKEKEREKETK